MQRSKGQLLRLCMTGAAVLLVGWGMWQCQGHRAVSIALVRDRHYARDDETSENGWPTFHTRQTTSREFDQTSWAETSVECERTAIFPGALIDVSVWCVVLIATGCVAWLCVAHGRQWSLRTVFGVFFVVAVLLGWWRWEYNIAAAQFPARYAYLYTVYSEAPMLTLLNSPWYIYVPVLFGLSCGIYCTGWIGGSVAAKIIKGVHHVAVSKLR
jgi:hypothetical protein